MCSVAFLLEKKHVPAFAPPLAPEFSSLLPRARTCTFGGTFIQVSKGANRDLCSNSKT